MGIAALLAATALTACGGQPAPEVSLIGAIGARDAGTVQQHMDAGTDPDNEFISKEYPEFPGGSALHIAVLVNEAEIVRILLDNGSDINIRARDDFEATPLAWASYWGIPEMVKLLVTSGADVNLPDINGCTPLCAAAIVNPFIPDTDREDFAFRRGTIQQFLVAQRANLK